MKEIERLINKIMREKKLKINLSRVRKAYDIAKDAHKHQKRDDGVDFFTHPYEVCLNLLKMVHNSKIDASMIDADVICAALLHDTVEDTGLNPEDIRRNFNKKTMDMVNALTKVEKKPEDYDGTKKSYDKLAAAGKRYKVVYFLKFADAMHNLKTLDKTSQRKQKRYSGKIKKYFIPLLKKEGFDNLADELNQLAGKYSSFN